MLLFKASTPIGSVIVRSTCQGTTPCKCFQHFKKKKSMSYAEVFLYHRCMEKRKIGEKNVASQQKPERG